MSNQMTPGEYLQECRKTAGKSARAVSIAIKADPSYVSSVERRNAVPPPDILVLLESEISGFSGLHMHRLAVEAERVLARAG